MMQLADHSADMRHLKHDPLQRREPFARIIRNEAPRLLGEVDQDGARLGECERSTARTVGIDDGRDLAVRIYLQKCRIALLALAQIDWNELIAEPELLQHDVQLVSPQVYSLITCASCQLLAG